MSACGQSVPFELFQCVVSQNRAGPNRKQYDEEIRKFAITLHFFTCQEPIITFVQCFI